MLEFRPVMPAAFAFLSATFLAGAVSAEGTDDLKGLTVSAAEEAVAEDGYTIMQELRDSPLRRGSIIDQFPRAGGIPGDDGVILVHVSDGLLLPDELVGKSGIQVEATLTDMGATVQITTRPVACTVGGIVADVAGLQPGTRFDATRDAVTLVVTETTTFTVPKIAAYTNRATMENALSAACLQLDYTDQKSERPRPTGDPCQALALVRTVDVTPAPGTVVSPNSVVRVIHRGEWMLKYSPEDPKCDEEPR